ncbi:hypothetical protein ASE74_04660 [Pedobacter sp. Leaf216]|nr:hypothetical protein ASE74_04660 [Pedobacter sp. Leaf216]
MNIENKYMIDPIYYKDSSSLAKLIRNGMSKVFVITIFMWGMERDVFKQALIRANSIKKNNP